MHLIIDAHRQHRRLHHQAEEDENHARRDRLRRQFAQSRADPGEFERSRMRRDQRQAEEHEARADGVEQEVLEALAPRRRGLFVGDRRPQSPGAHQLPEGEEAEDVLGLGHADQARDHHRERGEEAALPVAVGEIGGRVQHVERADGRDQDGEAEGQQIVATVLCDHADERGDQRRDRKPPGPDRRDAADEQHGDGADHGDRGARRPVGDEARQGSTGDRALERGEVADALDQRELPARRDAADHNRRRQRADRRQHRGGRLAHGFVALVGVIEQEADDASVVDDRNDSAEQHQRGDAGMAAHRRGVDHQELGDEAGERRQAHDGEACERVGRRP